MNLTVSDWITLIGIILSTIVSTVSVVIAVFSLRQNSKMIRESTRPYVTIYYTTVHVADVKGYFVIKNFGQTGAYITDFSYNKSLKTARSNEPKLLKHLDLVKGMYLAPQQKQVLAYLPEKIPEDICTFTIEYTDKISSYHETIHINISGISDIVKPRNAAKENSLHSISKSLEELVEQNL